MKINRNHNISYELFLFILLTVFVLIIGLINPAFFSVGTLFDVIRNQTLYLMLAFGLLPVVILGGLDISFVAVASLSTMIGRIVLATINYDGGIWFFYLCSMAAGILAGLLFGWAIATFKLRIFDFSLGLSTMINGILALTFQFRPREWNFSAIEGWSTNWLLTVQSAVGISGLHVSFLLVIATFILLSLFLRYTTLGRSIYALGSDKSVAIRTGINVKVVYLVVFGFLNAMSAMASTTSIGLGFGSSTFNAKYFTVYAMVMIGGGSVRGGRGSVLGTVFGVILVGLIAQALIYVRISTEWMDLVLGALLIAFTTYQALEQKLKK